MRKVIVYLAVIGMIVSLMSINGLSAESTQIASAKYGDLNGDDKINSTDYALMRRYLLDIIAEFPVSNGMIAADVNADTKVNSTDYALLRRFILSIITEFPAGTTIPNITPTPINYSEIYQAENATILQAITEDVNSGYTGSGYVNYDNVTGGYIEWSVNVPKSGAYDLILRFANGTTINRPLEIKVNGNTIRNSLDFNSTGAWTTWIETTIAVNLKQGINAIRATGIVADGGPNVDYVKVSTTNGTVPSPTIIPSPTISSSPTVVPTPSYIPNYKEVSVHDPSVIKTNNTYYVIGSHLAFAKTNDLIQWQQISSSVSNSNPLIPNVYTELKEAFDWAETTTMWAGDIIQLKDGKYYMYYNLCKGDSPRSALGLAVSDKVEGPYKNSGILLKSGMWGDKGADGKIYDAAIHPNTVDPDTFYDKSGGLWMVYGSYSGGIFILKLDPKTGKPTSGQGYGKKLLGANHSRIEAPYIQYSPESDYYYLFLSYGGLDATGGYNIRVARSKNPDGPYTDAAGKNMIDCHGPTGAFFDDKAIEPYGAKLMGNFRFAESGTGYVSPGHNSAYYDSQTDKYFIFFHTRFPGQGEMHQVRVHQMFINEDGWPVIAPHRYAGETIRKYSLQEVIGNYAYVNHGSEITANIKESVKISLNSDGTISGNVNGKWQLTGENTIRLTVNGVNYTGVVIQQWDNGLKKYVITFSALTRNGNVAVWGSRIN